jgi:hypothetical protein
MALDNWSATSFLEADLTVGTDFRSDAVGTLSFWLWRDASLNGAAVDISDAGTNENFLAYGPSQRFRIKSSTDLIDVTVGLTAANTWVNIVITQDGSVGASSWAIYYGNVLNVSGTSTAWLASLANLDRFTIGAWRTVPSVSWTAGPIADVAY